MGRYKFSSLEIESALQKHANSKSILSSPVSAFQPIRSAGSYFELQHPTGDQWSAYFPISASTTIPRPLIGAASAIGIPLICSGAKQEFMALVEGALSKADQLAADPPPAFEPVTRVGWHRNVFTTPRTFYPYPQNSMELCLGEVRGSLSYQRKGSLRQWKRAFQWSLQRNPYLLFAASLSLAPCLLKFANLEGCIICLVGRRVAERRPCSISQAPLAAAFRAKNWDLNTFREPQQMRWNNLRYKRTILCSFLMTFKTCQAAFISVQPS